MRLDHFIAKKHSLSERSAKSTIASGEVFLDGRVTKDHLEVVDRFCEVVCQGEILQPALERLHLMMNKPKGYLSATSDPDHPTVVDLIDHPAKATLHIAGRLDRASTGLLLLTNDSQWSEKLMNPEAKVGKVYLVETLDPISPDAVRLFSEGFYFKTENITTRPANLEILGSRKARVTIFEGKYHQIKRMFHRLNRNRLVSLHREQIGEIRLPANLQPGEWHIIDPKEKSCVESSSENDSPESFAKPIRTQPAE